MENSLNAFPRALAHVQTTARAPRSSRHGGEENRRCGFTRPLLALQNVGHSPAPETSTRSLSPWRVGNSLEIAVIEETKIADAPCKLNPAVEHVGRTSDERVFLRRLTDDTRIH